MEQVMREDTQGGTLWSQSIFDSLFNALQRQDSDAQVRELVDNLKEKGYVTDIIAKRVRKALGPQEADRIRRIGAGTGGASPPRARTRARPRYRVSRSKRLRNWMRDHLESMEDAFDRLRAVLRRR